MFIKTKHYDTCIQKVRIEVGTLVGLEADDEAYIVLKELPTLEMLKLKEASEQGENQTLTLLRDLLPSILVDHNFYEDADAKRKMDNREVASLVFESLDLTVKVVNEYTHAAFFPVRTRAAPDRIPLLRGLQRKKKRRALRRVRTLALLHNRYLSSLLRL